MARKPPRRSNDSIWPDNPKELVAWVVFAGVIISLLALWSADPFLLSTVQSDIAFAGSGNAGSSAPSSTSDEVLLLDQTDAIYMNRIFEERSHEIAWCGLVDGDELTPWLADTHNASKDRLSFSTENCPGGRPEATIHTHPSGNLGLSTQDRNLFYLRGDTYMCILGGQITTTPGEVADRMGCYEKIRHTGGFDFAKVHILITGPNSP